MVKRGLFDDRGTSNGFWLGEGVEEMFGIEGKTKWVEMEEGIRVNIGKHWFKLI